MKLRRSSPRKHREMARRTLARAGAMPYAKTCRTESLASLDDHRLAPGLCGREKTRVSSAPFCSANSSCIADFHASSVCPTPYTRISEMEGANLPSRTAATKKYALHRRNCSSEHRLCLMPIDTLVQIKALSRTYDFKWFCWWNFGGR